MSILGIDEVGRGPWAGPLVVGGVILEDASAKWCEELTDSKKLTKKKRNELNEKILKNAPATALAWVSSKELDEMGLSNALRLANRRVVEEIRRKKVPFNEIIIDGTINFLSDTSMAKYVTTLKKADLLIKEVSAASIIAKVARDTYMENLAKSFPEYGFEKHVGYGTTVHKTAIEKFGLTPEHRHSFKPIKNFDKSTTKELGDRAENVVAEYLSNNDHAIIARNHKTKFYEIDIVSIKDDKLYFTEVKYRKSQSRGTSLEQITTAKLKQMRFAAENFIKFRKDLKDFSPILAAASVSGEDFTFDDWFPLV